MENRRQQCPRPMQVIAERGFCACRSDALGPGEGGGGGILNKVL